MWMMLCERAQDLKIDVSGIEADDRTGRAHWEAWYTFTQTGRRVHNVIDATFEFRNGKIVRHRDSFDFWAWSRQALGAIGIALGWSSLLRKRIRGEAARNLERFVRKRRVSS
jgi:hypothetical protein